MSRDYKKEQEGYLGDIKEKQILVGDVLTINTLAKIIFWVFLNYMLFGELPIGKIRFPLFIVTIYMVGKFFDFIEMLWKKKKG